MPDVDGRVRLSVSFDAKEVDAGVRSVRQSFDGLAKSATRAVAGARMDEVTRSAKEAGDGIKDLQDGMSGMSAAEAKLAAQLARALAQVQHVSAQIAEANRRAEESASKLAIRQQSLQDSLAKTSAEAERLQAEWDAVEHGLKRDRSTGELLPGQEDKIAQLDKLGAKMADLDDKARRYKVELDNVIQRLKAMDGQAGAGDTQSALKAKLDAAITTADALQKKLDELRAGGGRLSAIVRGISSVGSAVRAGLSSALTGVGSLATSGIRALGRLASRQLTRVTKMLEPVAKGFRRIGRLAMSAFLFQGLSQAFRRITEGFNELIAKDKQLKAQISTIKGNLTSAFAPLWTVIRPALEALLNVVIAITSALANLSQALFGSAGGASKLAGAFSSAGGAAKSAGSAAKEAQDQLGGFDEINQLDDKKASGGGGGGGGGASSGLITDLTWTINDLYDKLLAFDWDAFAGRINRSLLGIKWDKIGRAFRQGIGYITGAMDTLLTGINWEALGGRIAQGANELVQALPDIATTLKNWFNAKIRLFYGFVSTFDFGAFGTTLGRSLATVVVQTDWRKLIQGFGKLATGILDGLVAAIRAMDTDEVKAALKDILSTALDTMGTLVIHLSDVIFGTDGNTLISGLDESLQKILLAALALTGLVLIGTMGVVGGLLTLGVGVALGLSIVSAVVDGDDAGIDPGLLEGYSSFSAMIAGGVISIGEFSAALNEAGYSMEDAESKAEGMFTAIERINALYINGVYSVDEYKAILMEWGLTAEQADRRAAELAGSSQSLAVQFANGDISAEEYRAALIELGLSAEAADWKVAGLKDGFSGINTDLASGKISIAEYIDAFVSLGGRTDEAADHLAALGYSVSEIEAAMGNTETSAANTTGSIAAMGDAAKQTATPMSELAETASRVETASDGASDATKGLSANLAEASSSGEALAGTTEEVADNATDASKQAKKYGDQMGKTADSTDDLQDVQSDLSAAVVDVADATTSSSEDMAASLATNLSGWRYYAQQLSAILQGLAATQRTFWDSFRISAQVATSAVQEQISGLASGMQSTLKGAWQSVIGSINGSDGGGGLGQGISASFKTAVNQLIRGLNSTLKTSFAQINNVFSKLKNTQVMGKYPFSYLPSIKIPSIPALAKGAVIPANREFLAILGDQKSGTNVEAPLDTITEAMMIVLRAQGGAATPEAIASAVRSALTGMGVYFDRQQAGRIMASAINDNRRADGRFAYDL